MPTDPAPPCVVFASSAPAGSAPHANMAAFWLSSRGWPVTLICPAESSSKAVTTPLGQVDADTFIPGSVPAMQVSLLVRLMRGRRRAGKRAVFLVAGSPVCPAALLGLAGIPSKRIIYQTQDFLQPGRHPHWEFFERRFARRAGAVVSNEPNRADALRGLYRLEVSPAVLPTALPAAWPMPERDERIRNSLLARAGCGGLKTACIVHAGGQYSPARCSSELALAIAALPERFLIVFTGMTGPGRNAAAGRAALERHGIMNRSILLDHLEYDALLKTFAAADVGVLLYPNDGIGNYYQQPGRLTEYVGCGLPFVTSAFPGLSAITERHALGEAVDPGSPSALAAALSRIGARPESVTTSERARLKKLARTQLAYDRNAGLLESMVRNASND